MKENGLAENNMTSELNNNYANGLDQNHESDDSGSEM